MAGLGETQSLHVQTHGAQSLFKKLNPEPLPPVPISTPHRFRLELPRDRVIPYCPVYWHTEQNFGQ
jgi:hypothetical protein